MGIGPPWLMVAEEASLGPALNSSSPEPPICPSHYFHVFSLDTHL